MAVGLRSRGLGVEGLHPSRHLGGPLAHSGLAEELWCRKLARYECFIALGLTCSKPPKSNKKQLLQIRIQFLGCWPLPVETTTSKERGQGGPAPLLPGIA